MRLEDTYRFAPRMVTGINNGWLTDAKYIGQAPLLWSAIALLSQNCPGVH